MAAASKTTQDIVEDAVRGEGNAAWTKHFSEEMRRELMLEDLHAGRTVPWLLTALIFGGVFLAGTTVILVWKFL